jgi:ABC-type nitrate/sulfonate/bicarbonate transport system permease component
MVETAASYGLSRTQLIRKVLIPAAMPQVLTGVRISIGLGVAVMVVANMFGAAEGIGARVVLAQHNFDIRGTWAGIFMIAIVGMLITSVYTVIHHRLLAWHRGWRQSASAA